MPATYGNMSYYHYDTLGQLVWKKVDVKSSVMEADW